MQKLDEIIGQTTAVNILKTAVKAYFHERESKSQTAFPHTILTGPGGTGKTMLSEIVAETCRSAFHTQLGQNLRNPESVHAALFLLEPGDIIFIDEIHELQPTCAVTLYRALEERKLILGNNHVFHLPPFTLMAATTHEHCLSISLRDRFRIICRLTYYTTEELTLLIEQRAARNGWIIVPDAACELAKRSRGVARIAARFLESAHRQATAEKSDEINLHHVFEMFRESQIDDLGLDSIEQQYLKLLSDKAKPIRLNLVASVLGLPRASIEMIEADLLRLGLIEKCDQGRILTNHGINHIRGKK